MMYEEAALILYNENLCELLSINNEHVSSIKDGHLFTYKDPWHAAAPIHGYMDC